MLLGKECLENAFLKRREHVATLARIPIRLQVKPIKWLFNMLKTEHKTTPEAYRYAFSTEILLFSARHFIKWLNNKGWTTLFQFINKDNYRRFHQWVYSYWIAYLTTHSSSKICKPGITQLIPNRRKRAREKLGLLFLDLLQFSTCFNHSL